MQQYKETKPICIMTDRLARLKIIYIENKKLYKISDILKVRDGMSDQSALFRITNIIDSNANSIGTKLCLEHIALSKKMIEKDDEEE